MHPVVRVLSGAMALFFLLGVAVQVNDPDPLRWMLVYGGAAAASLLGVRGEVPIWLPVAVGVVALAWAAIIAPDVIGTVRATDLFREVRMDSPAIELGREAFGLGLIGLWMAVLVVAQRARRTG